MRYRIKPVTINTPVGELGGFQLELWEPSTSQAYDAKYTHKIRLIFQTQAEAIECVSVAIAYANQSSQAA